MRPKIDLAAAVAAAEQHQAAPLTFKELVLGFNTSSAGDYDWRLKKWIEAFGQTPAWDISSELLENAAAAMLKAGYKPSTVNRDLSAIGTCYKWAKRQRLTPKGFRSPTLGVSRYNEGIRRVEVSAQDIADLRARSLTVRDPRFGIFVHLLIDTGARKSELLERLGADFDLDKGSNCAQPLWPPRSLLTLCCHLYRRYCLSPQRRSTVAVHRSRTRTSHRCSTSQSSQQRPSAAAFLHRDCLSVYRFRGGDLTISVCCRWPSFLNPSEGHWTEPGP